nr:hypothetical protein [Flavonifractor sp. An135]
MKRVLWISRHQMTAEQRSDLERVIGEAVELHPWTETVEDLVELHPWTETVEDLADLRPEVERADAVAAVLPVELLAELVRLAGKRPVFQTAAVRTPTGRFHTLPDGRREPEFAFAHGGWQQILRLELEVKHLSKKS